MVPNKSETIKIMGVILREVSKKPIQRKALQRRVEFKGISSATFDAVFYFLIRDGNIKKASCEHRAPFCVTEKGLMFLAWRGIC